ncbi:LmeA family phospholipid-binding protein [Corynebacterium renale]|uniref:DUF2993 family protein n=1 Tax=Corynebacterium renale TaxID=1724 RepID=A0A2A9DKY9_9CORY|nr:LmeA family phospholipid-binding protein [Corynebacterium renale]PFG27358.1 hypothetical protein ATK06_0414 [Corynebacterium renale]SQI23555.1 Uncharacterised protein [Corynebacterium renale]
MKTLGKVIGGILAVIIVLAIVAELGMRWFIGNQVEEQYGQDASISFGASPVLASVFTGKVGHMDLTIPATTDAPAANVTAQGLDVRDQQTMRADQMEVTTDISDALLLNILQRGMAAQTGGGFLADLIKITDVTSNPSEGTLDIEFTGGAANLSLTPTTEGNQAVFTVAETRLFGLELPTEVSEAISQALQDGLHNQLDAAGGLQLTGMAVTENGLQLHLSGEHVELQQAADARHV